MRLLTPANFCIINCFAIAVAAGQPTAVAIMFTGPSTAPSSASSSSSSYSSIKSLIDIIIINFVGLIISICCIKNKIHNARQRVPIAVCVCVGVCACVCICVIVGKSFALDWRSYLIQLGFLVANCLLAFCICNEAVGQSERGWTGGGGQAERRLQHVGIPPYSTELICMQFCIIQSI